MTTLRAAILATLTASSSWTTLVNGGTNWFEGWGRNGLEPDTFVVDSNGRLKLSCVLTMGTRGKAEIDDSTERGFVRVWLYHDTSYELVEQAQDLAKTLLHKKQIAVTGKHTPMLVFVDHLQEFSAQELGGAAAGCSRYTVQYRI